VGEAIDQGSECRHETTIFWTAQLSGPLSEETQLNIMAYILKLNGALPGSQALTASTDVHINRLTTGPQVQ
jgi:hypothetical protein